MSRLNRKWIILVLLCAAGVTYWVRVKNQSSMSFHATMQDHPGLSAADWKNRFVLVHFWAKWCEPCAEEIPKLVQFAEQVSKDNPLNERLKILAISLDPTLDESRSILPLGGRSLPASFILVLDHQERLARAFGSYQYPESYLLSPTGELLQKWVGPQKWMAPEVLAYFRARVGLPPSSH